MRGAEIMKRTTIKQLCRTPELPDGFVQSAQIIKSALYQLTTAAFLSACRSLLKRISLKIMTKLRRSMSAARFILREQPFRPPTQNSRLSLMRKAPGLRVRQLPIIRFRKNAIRMNISEQLRICAPERIPFRLFSV